MSRSKDETTGSQQQEAEQGKVILEDDGIFSKGFTQVPNAVLRHPDLSDGAKLTYSMLLSYAWSDNSSFPGQERLAQDLGKDSRSVRRHLTELKEKKLIRVERRGMGLTNIYYIHTTFEADRTKMSDQDRTKMSHLDRTKMSDKEYEESKNTQINNTKSFERQSLKTEKGRGEGSNSARSHIARRTIRNRKEEETKENTGGSGSTPTHNQTPTQRRVARIEASKQRTPLQIGPPITQDEIDEKRRSGQNASGFTPLAGIIPSSHWQELQTKAATIGK